MTFRYAHSGLLLILSSNVVKTDKTQQNKKIGHQIHRKHYITPKNLSLDLADWWNRNNHKKDTSSQGVTTFFAKSVEEKENGVYPTLVHYLKYDIDMLLKCNVSPHDSDQCWKANAPVFWKEIFKYWWNYNYVKTENVQEPRKQMIWLNSNIKVGNKLYLLKELYERNIFTLNDLLISQENRIASFTEVQRRYQTKISFLNYHSLVHAACTRLW